MADGTRGARVDAEDHGLRPGRGDGDRLGGHGGVAVAEGVEDVDPDVEPLRDVRRQGPDEPAARREPAGDRLPEGVRLVGADLEDHRRLARVRVVRPPGDDQRAGLLAAAEPDGIEGHPGRGGVDLDLELRRRPRGRPIVAEAVRRLGDHPEAVAAVLGEVDDERRLPVRVGAEVLPVGPAVAGHPHLDDRQGVRPGLADVVLERQPPGPDDLRRAGRRRRRQRGGPAMAGGPIVRREGPPAGPGPAAGRRRRSTPGSSAADRPGRRRGCRRARPAGGRRSGRGRPDRGSAQGAAGDAWATSRAGVGSSERPSGRCRTVVPTLPARSATATRTVTGSLVAASQVASPLSLGVTRTCRQALAGAP